MSNNFDITIDDFENICRTCLSREDLKSLYEKCFSSTCLADKLMSCTFVTFTEDDGLPVKICTNCINEINQAFSFAKRCETTDIILRKCVKIKIELASNSSQSQNVEAEEEMQIEIKPEVILPNIRRTVDGVSKDFEYVEVKQEKIEYEEFVERQNEDVIIENEYDETYDNPGAESYEEEDVDEDQDKTYEKLDMPTNSQIEDDDSSPAAKKIRPKPPYYECNKCFEKFPDFKGIKKHREEVKHPPNAPSLCIVCNKMIEYANVKKHMRTHTGAKPYCCEICGDSFSQAGSVSRHKRVCHFEPNDLMYQCQNCEKSFKRLDLLKAHERREKREKILSRDFQCTVCGRAYTTKRLLKEHSAIHGKKKYLCSVCGKSFVSKSLLCSHSKIHTTNRPYACHMCEKAFSKLEYLKSHKLIHTGEKPNVCSVCKKAFAHRTTLKRHMRIHTGEKPYICPFCGKVSNDASNMKKHVQAHGEKNLVSASKE